MANELSCPNCGAGYTLPVMGNQVECAFCGSRFLIPESLRTHKEAFIALGNSTLPQTQVDIRRWVRWLVVFIIVVTVVPVVCSIGAVFCGALAPFAALVFGR